MNQTTTPGDEYLRCLSWEEKARRNPLYGVMSVNEFSSAGPEPTASQLEAFFGAGRVMVDRWIVPWLDASVTSTDAFVLEYGCGMGRLLRALHERYPNVAGVDISSTMVERARKYVPGPRLKLLGEEGRIPFADETFDNVFSYAVFQHVDRWSAIQRAILELGRVLKRGGRAKLQFDMVFPPGISTPRAMPRRTRAWENRSLVYGWGSRMGVPLPGVRVLSHDHWCGARPGYTQVVEAMHRANLRVYGLESIIEAPHLVWFLACRMSA
jgi:SAM-dependent methyltransferase